MLFNLVTNELQKIIKKKRILLILATLCVTIFLSYLNTFNSFKASSNKPKLKIQQNEKSLLSINKKLNNSVLSTKERQSLVNQNKYLKINTKTLKKLASPQKSQWKKILKEEVTDLQNLKSNIYKDNTTQKSSINNKIDMDNYYINHNINPNDYNHKFNATKFSSEIFSFLNILFLPLIIILGCCDTVSGENNPPTIKVLLTKPISRGKILFSKFISSIISITLSLFLCEFLTFIIIGIVFKFGNLLSPVVVGFDFKHIKGIQRIAEIGTNSHIIPMWQFLIEALCLQILFIIATASLATLISVFVKNTSASTSINFVVIIILTFTNFLMLTNSGSSPKSPFITKILPFLFTTYSNGIMLLSGNINRFTGITFINVKLSILVLIAWTIICYGIAHFKFTKQDVFA